MGFDELNKQREAAFCDAFGLSFPYVPPEPDFSPDIDPRKILVLSDPHEPYSAQYVFDHALENHHDAGLLIVPGDLGDYYSKSRFKKPKPGNFKEEVRAVFHRMEWLSARWPVVRIMLGNHDNRPEKKIQSLLDVDTELLVLTETNLLKHLACYFPNIEIVEHRIEKTSLGLTYLWQFGDMVFTHGEISRAQDTATLDYISSWLHTWRHLLNLKPYRFIGQGHNHQSMKKDVDGETWMMFPTASDPYSLGMEYVFQGMRYKKPPVVGYSILHHDNGSVSTNECFNIVLRNR